jgi:hypothetical protein
VHEPVTERDDDRTEPEKHGKHQREQHRHLAALARATPTGVCGAAGVVERYDTLITTDLPQRDQPLSLPTTIICTSARNWKRLE